MDLTPFYEEYAETYKLATIGVILAVAVTVFLLIRISKDPNEAPRKKRVYWIICLVFIVVVFLNYFQGPCNAQKDIEQQTIYAYEGTIEITNVKRGLANNATFIMQEKEIRLYFYENEKFDMQIIENGQYVGKIIYSEHVENVLYLEFYN